ncbi:DsbA family protein [Cereibacter sp. SYSU M97828]|nr:DsbA family protein [Cereibacter flavus]
MRHIDYFFGIGSPWAYLGLDAFAALAASHGATIEPHAIPLIEENGGIYSRDRPTARREYWLEDLKRWAHLRGIELSFDRAALSDPTPAARLIVAAWLDGQDWLALARALHRAFWSQARDIGAADVRIVVATEAGFDGAGLEARAAKDDVDARLALSLKTATEAGVFGIPTYRHDGTLFWGQDSLPFLDRHLRGEKLIA